MNPISGFVCNAHGCDKEATDTYPNSPGWGASYYCAGHYRIRFGLNAPAPSEVEVEQLAI